MQSSTISTFDTSNLSLPLPNPPNVKDSRQIMEELNLLDPTGPTFEMMAEEDVDFRRMMKSLDTLLSEATGALFHGPIPGKRSKPIHQRKKETPTIDRRVPVNAEPFCLVGVTDTVVRTESLWRLRKKDERDATLYWSSFFSPAVYSSGLRILLLPKQLFEHSSVSYNQIHALASFCPGRQPPFVSLFMPRFVHFRSIS
jgi:hypothetical protein